MQHKGGYLTENGPSIKNPTHFPELNIQVPSNQVPRSCTDTTHLEGAGPFFAPLAFVYLRRFWYMYVNNLLSTAVNNYLSHLD